MPYGPALTFRLRVARIGEQEIDNQKVLYLVVEWTAVVSGAFQNWNFSNHRFWTSTEIDDGDSSALHFERHYANTPRVNV